MRFRPDRFEMIEGETNRLEINLGPVSSGSSVSSLGLESSGLTFTTPSISGKTATSLVSGGAADTDYIVTITTALSSGETKVGAITLEWKRPGFEGRTAPGAR